MNKISITAVVAAIALGTLAEARAESRKAVVGYPNVTFRVAREDR